MGYRMWKQGTPITHSTKNSTEGIRVEGHRGKWYTVDSLRYRGKTFYVLEHETYGEDAAHVLVDKFARLVLEDLWDNSIEEIHDFIDDAWDDVFKDEQEVL